MLDHEEARALLPAYSLGCVDPEELEDLRAHIESCELCRRELAELLDLSGEIALTLPPLAPPARLEGRVLASLRRAAAAARSAGGAVPPRRRKAVPYLLGAVAAALIVILGAGDLILLARLRRVESASGGGLVTLVLRGTELAPSAFGTLVLDPDDVEGVLAVRDLPRLEPGQSYALWLVKAGMRESAGAFSVDAQGYGSLVLDVPKALRDFDAFVVVRVRADGGAGSGRPLMEGRR